jgi:hypothetical protein
MGILPFPWQSPIQGQGALPMTFALPLPAVPTLWPGAIIGVSGDDGYGGVQQGQGVSLVGGAGRRAGKRDRDTGGSVDPSAPSHSRGAASGRRVARRRDSGGAWRDDSSDSGGSGSDGDSDVDPEQGMDVGEDVEDDGDYDGGPGLQGGGRAAAGGYRPNQCGNVYVAWRGPVLPNTQAPMPDMTPSVSLFFCTAV